jgi:hypothetical protein
MRFPAAFASEDKFLTTALIEFFRSPSPPNPFVRFGGRK